MNNSPQTIIPIRLGYVRSFLIKGAKTVIVDTGYPGNGERILDHLRAHRIDPNEIGLILVTHGHIDHYGSAHELRRLTGAPIAMHRADAEYVKKGINYVGRPTGILSRLFKTLLIRKDEPIYKTLEVDIAFEDEVDLKAFGIDGRILHTPGHTPGSVSMMLSDGTAVVGDLLMGGAIRKRMPRLPLFANDPDQLRKSIEKVLSFSPNVILASHGGPFSREAVERFVRKIRK